ncbi:hypothetical protein [Hyphobacterium sp.]|uniref:hypothetical protein n=1 Tax=Hyphobacterium sp. TaxID=2004662 RepID=UPI003747BE4A
MSYSITPETQDVLDASKRGKPKNSPAHPASPKSTAFRLAELFSMQFITPSSQSTFIDLKPIYQYAAGVSHELGGNSITRFSIIVELNVFCP